MVWCRCVRDDGKECLGNKESVCYHCLATILAGIDQAKVRVEWFDSLDHVLNSGVRGRVVRIKSSQSEKTMFGVIVNNEITPAQGQKEG